MRSPAENKCQIVGMHMVYAYIADMPLSKHDYSEETLYMYFPTVSWNQSKQGIILDLVCS